VLWILLAVTAVAIVVIALVAVGRVTASLALEPPRSTYDLDEAVEFVADRLPDEVTAAVSFDDVRAVLGYHLDYLEAKGVAREADVRGDEAHPPAWGPVVGPLVADDDEALPYVMGRLAEEGREVDDVHLVHVLDADEAYLVAIGAIGRAVPLPPDPGRGAA
jgi:hypothetical protein